jgi:hypothetical protein
VDIAFFGLAIEVFLFGMWRILSCHKIQFELRCVAVSEFAFTPVSCGGFYFLHIGYVALCWFLVLVDVALHRTFYFAHIGKLKTKERKTWLKPCLD